MDNIQIIPEKNIAIVKINTKIFPLDIIYSASYVFLDRAYISLDGDPEKQINVFIKPKENQNLQTIGQDFNNEIINYAVYKVQSEKAKELRETFMKRILATNLEGEKE